MLNFLLQFEHVTVTSSSGSMNMLPTLEEEVRGLFEGMAFFGGEAFRFREDPADLRESRERDAFFAPERPAFLIPERSFFSAPDFLEIPRDFDFPEAVPDVLRFRAPDAAFLRFFMCLPDSGLNIYVFCFLRLCTF